MKILVCLKQVPHQDARLDIDDSGAVLAELERARGAVERAAALTKQLLVFSGRKVGRPVALERSVTLRFELDA